MRAFETLVTHWRLGKRAALTLLLMAAIKRHGYILAIFYSDMVCVALIILSQAAWELTWKDFP